jgi:hypothetical protein
MGIQDHRNILVVHNFTFVNNTVNGIATSDPTTPSKSSGAVGTPAKTKQVRPDNLLHDKEWEADYYDLKRSSTSSSVTSPSTSYQSPWKEDGRESTKDDSDDDKEWEVQALLDASPPQQPCARRGVGGRLLRPEAQLNK